MIVEINNYYFPKNINKPFVVIDIKMCFILCKDWISKANTDCLLLFQTKIAKKKSTFF